MTGMWIGVGVVLAPWMLCVLYGLFLAYKHYHLYPRPASDFKLLGTEARKVRIASDPGIELDGLLLPAVGSEHLVIIAHELGTFKESKLRIARRLCAENFNVLLFDLRNHGASSHDRSAGPMSELFTNDIEAAIRFGRERLAMKTITLYAFSLSTFASLYVVDRPSEQPDALVLDSGPIMTVHDNAARFMDEFREHMVPAFFRHPLLYPVLKAAFNFFTLRMLATSWPPDLSRVRSRILFIANGKDRLFPAEEIRRLADKIPHSRFWVCSDAPHLQAYRTDPEGYEKVLFDFLRQPREAAGAQTATAR